MIYDSTICLQLFLLRTVGIENGLSKSFNRSVYVLGYFPVCFYVTLNRNISIYST